VDPVLPARRLAGKRVAGRRHCHLGCVVGHAADCEFAAPQRVCHGVFQRPHCKWYAARAPTAAVLHAFSRPGHEQGLLKLWTHDGALSGALDGHTLTIRDLVFHSNDVHLVSASDDDTVRMWDVHTRLCVGVFDERLGLVASLALTKDGLLAIAYKEAHLIYFWRLGERQNDEDAPLKVMPIEEPVKVSFAPVRRAAGQEVYISTPHDHGTLRVIIM